MALTISSFSNSMDNTAEVDSDTMLDQILMRQEFQPVINYQMPQSAQEDSMYSKTRAFLVALLGLSVSACSFTSQQRGLLQYNEAESMSSVSAGRRYVMGSSMTSTVVTAVSSLLLMLAVMSKASWWQRGARWLAAPAMLAAAVEICADTADAALTTALMSGTAVAPAMLNAVGATLLITAEVLIWYFIAKFFEHDTQRFKTECNKCRSMSRKTLNKSKSESTL